MSWWGKLVGGAFGFMLGGPLGAVLGAALGHNFDKGLGQMGGPQAFGAGDQERVQTAFFTTTFSVMGHLAKADGQVSREEIALAQHVMAQMNLSPEMRKTAIHLFDEGKKSNFPLDEVLDQFRKECHRRVTLIQMFIEILLQAAFADGRMDTAEEQMLLHICERLGVPRAVFLQLKRRMQAQHYGTGGQSGGAAPGSAISLSDAYATLNASKDMSDAEIKKAYRRLMSQHHPDKLVSKGLPEEMIKLAEQKTHEIRQAYERISEHRKM
ncbi:MAG: co-chaperone DjlA [gamma proteobacterium symbiont of Bathyaustriella thionipta]|nr:co-chaperone DjlA [gamma proteobacterium symbiont of Bathyaustriella thionipta]